MAKCKEVFYRAIRYSLLIGNILSFKLGILLVFLSLFGFYDIELSWTTKSDLKLLLSCLLLSWSLIIVLCNGTAMAGLLFRSELLLNLYSLFLLGFFFLQNGISIGIYLNANEHKESLKQLARVLCKRVRHNETERYNSYAECTQDLKWHFNWFIDNIWLSQIVWSVFLVIVIFVCCLIVLDMRRSSNRSEDEEETVDLLRSASRRTNASKFGSKRSNIYWPYGTPTTLESDRHSPKSAPRILSYRQSGGMNHSEQGSSMVSSPSANGTHRKTRASCCR